jgi:hypothetical protein
MNLLDLQRRMAHAILRPLSNSDRIAPATDAAFIKPNDRLSSLKRLEIYSRSYWFRVLDSLYEDFPGLRAVLGQRAFHRLSRAYLTVCPSRSFTLRNLGSRLEDWMRSNPRYSGTRQALALDMARLEWAHIEAFDNASEKVLGPEDLLELGPRFRAGLQPYVRLLALEYPVDDLRIQVNRESQEHGAVSSAALKHERRHQARWMGWWKPERIFLAVHRLDFTVYYRRIRAEEYRLLSALREGQPIGKAIRTAFENTSASADKQLAMLESWFAAWAELGWLCVPVSRRKKGDTGCNSWRSTIDS